MFDISWGKLVIIGVVALIVIGPKELPAVLRTLGQWMAKIRRMAGEFQGQFNEAMREAEMADLKKQFDDTASTLNSALDTTSIKNDMEKLINDPMGTEASATSTPASPLSDPPVATPTPSDPVALGTAPVAPADIAVPMPDLPPPVETKDFATATPAPEPAKEPASEAPASAPQAPGGKAA
jgi:sec-independent protein translocase protein TatB